MEQFSLSVVLPVGAQASALAATVAECLALRVRPGVDLEVIIADDAGDSSAAELADRLAATHNAVAVIRYPRRRGYRQTLHDAWGAARGRYLVALDLAGPAAAADITRLLAVAAGQAAVFGYRAPAPRRPAELAFALAVGARLAPDLRDPSLGLGLFRADLRDLLDPDGPDALTHAEIFAAAHRRGLAIAQVAVDARAARTSAPSIADITAALRAGGGAGSDHQVARGAAAGAGMLLAACGLWLLRRRRRL